MFLTVVRSRVGREWDDVEKDVQNFAASDDGTVEDDDVDDELGGEAA